MIESNETVTQLLRRRAVERAFGEQLADEDFSKKGNGILIATLNEGKR